MKNFFAPMALAAALVAGAVPSYAEPNCQTHVNTDQGQGGVQVYSCDDNSAGIGFGGPVKDVDVAHPLGKGKAFFPQAGRDAQSVVSHAGHTVEDGAHWVGDRLGIHF
jgi:hypothetical protein